MKNTAKPTCTRGPNREAGGLVLPVPAVVIVIVVLLLTTGLVAWGLSAETVIATISVAGLLGVELIHRIATVVTPGHPQV